MPIRKPKGTDLAAPVPPQDVFQLLRYAREEEQDLQQLRFENALILEEDLSRLSFSGCVFDHCRFSGSFGERMSFQDIRFVECDLSNCNFSDAYLCRCRLESCKGVGLKLPHCRMKDVAILGGNYRYFAAPRSRLEHVLLEQADLSGLDLPETIFKDVGFAQVSLPHANFFRTPLSGIDFTTCDISGMELSSDLHELAGVMVDVYQAAELAKLMGVVLR